jgi:uncharacterized protein
MLDPQSAVLTALYHGKRDEAEQLAEGAALTIWEAAALGRGARVAELLDADPSLLDRMSPDGYHPLGLAAFFGADAVARLLLDRGANVATVAANPMRIQALHAAVAARNPVIVSMLLEHGADANARQHVGYTPLMGAASAGQTEILEMLLRAGADPSQANDEGKTAADFARDKGHAAVLERLAGT